MARYKRHHADAEASFARAMERAPNDASVFSRAALGELYEGDFDAAILLFRHSFQLDPLHADRQRGLLGHALFHAGHYDKAIAEFEMIKDLLMWESAWPACCHAMQGDTEGAAIAAAVFRAHMQAGAQTYRAKIRPFKREAVLQRLESAMLPAGLSEQ